MIIYLVIVILLLLSSNNKSRISYILITIFLLILGCIRDITVGTDTLNYFYHFISIGKDIDVDLSSNRGTEILYNAIAAFCNKNGLSYRVMMIIEMIQFLLPIAYVLKQESKRPIFALMLLFLLGFYFNSFNISRQMMAVSFVFLSLYYFSKDKLLETVIFFTMAFFSHSTALFALIIYPIKYLKIDYRIWIVLIIVSMVSSYSINTTNIIIYAISIIPPLAQYIYYIDNSGEHAANFQLFATLTNFIYIYIVWKQYKLSKNKFGHYTYSSSDLQIELNCPTECKKPDVFLLDDFWGKISVYGMVLNNLFLFVPDYFSRLFIYINICQVVYLTNVAYNNRLNKFLILSYAFLYFCIYTIYFKIDGVIPYATCF